VSLFSSPADEEKRNAVAALSDADLVGRYWRLEDLTGLTADERLRLQTYRLETFGYEDYCEKLVAHRPRGATDVAHLTAVVDHWDRAFYNLRLWHVNRAHHDIDRNPVAKVLIFEESRITGVRARLQVGTVPSAPPRSHHPGPGSTPAPHLDTIPDPAPGSRAGLETPASTPDGARAIITLADSVATLAEAINRLTDSISRR
jgi:hypothetical protein